jgi:hypothetical protein
MKLSGVENSRSCIIRTADKSKTILDLDMLNEYDKIDLLQPVTFTQPVSG